MGSIGLCHVALSNCAGLGLGQLSLGQDMVEEQDRGCTQDISDPRPTFPGLSQPRGQICHMLLRAGHCRYLSPAAATCTPETCQAEPSTRQLLGQQRHWDNPDWNRYGCESQQAVGMLGRGCYQSTPPGVEAKQMDLALRMPRDFMQIGALLLPTSWRCLGS